MLGSGKKLRKDKEDETIGGNEKSQDKPPSALRLILKFEGPPDSNQVMTNNVHHSTNNSSGTTLIDLTDDSSVPSLLKKKKKKKKNKDPDKKKHRKEAQENLCIVLESSETLTRDQREREVPPKHEMQAERERRLGVPSLRQKQTNKSPLQRLLEYLHQQLEDKDLLQVFAWPVTEQIAPGYSKVVKDPMDLSTIRQKNDDNLYRNFIQYKKDFELMCTNAMQYNRPDTMYHKAAKRLLHSGMKFLSVEKMRQLASSLPLIKEIPPEQLGFDLETGALIELIESSDDSDKDIPDKKDTSKKRGRSDLTQEQALELAQKSACTYDERQLFKRRKTTLSMGFLRQRQDGSTSLAIFVPGEGVDPERPAERVVTLGQLVGKLTHGTGQLQGFREHRRNFAKAIKPLSYGPFGSYAPSYDSTFANLSKEESDLIYETYGEESSNYVMNVLNLAKVCDYTLVMVDNLLDHMSGGEYKKSKNVIDDQRKYQEEEERVRELIESNKTNNVQTDAANVKIEFQQLKTLSELGIDTSFLKEYESLSDNENAIQDKLDQTSQLLEKLHQVQTERLSAPPPSHLSQISHPSEKEVDLAEKITDSLTDMTKLVSPASIIPVPGIRKAMGVVPDTGGEADTEAEIPSLHATTTGIPLETNTTETPLLEPQPPQIIRNGTAFSLDDNSSEDMLCDS